MPIFNLQQVGNECLYAIKSSVWFPYRSGKLRDEATSGRLLNKKTYHIKFDSSIAPYIEFLENGTKEHDIPHAFGYGTFYPDRANPYTKAIPFGVGGRFNGKFHPGSTKHQGFISVKCINKIINYIALTYKGRVVYKGE